MGACCGPHSRHMVTPTVMSRSSLCSWHSGPWPALHAVATKEEVSQQVGATFPAAGGAQRRRAATRSRCCGRIAGLQSQQRMPPGRLKTRPASEQHCCRPATPARRCWASSQGLRSQARLVCQPGSAAASTLVAAAEVLPTASGARFLQHTNRALRLTLAALPRSRGIVTNASAHTSVHAQDSRAIAANGRLHCCEEQTSNNSRPTLLDSHCT